jgi:outer membrane lipoprotein LolB
MAALAGCATAPSAIRERPEALPLSGRISVKVEGPSPKSVSAVFDLQGNSTAGSLGLSTPLGSMLAQARWTPGQVTLTTPRGQTTYADLDDLTRAVLGESVPIAAMFDWLRARPWAEAPSKALSPGARSFEQLGWTVDLGRFDSGSVDAYRRTGQPVTVKVRLD